MIQNQYVAGMLHVSRFIRRMTEAGLDTEQINENVKQMNKHHCENSMNRFSLGVRRACLLHLTKPASVIKPKEST